MSMKNLPHPGTLVRHGCLDELALSVSAGADILGVGRQALSSVVNARGGISPDMAIRLEKAFGSTRNCVHAGLAQLVLPHLSEQCNDSEIALTSMCDAVASTSFQGP